LVIGIILGFLLLLLLLAFVFRRKIEKYRRQKDVELVLVANQGPAPGTFAAEVFEERDVKE